MVPSLSLYKTGSHLYPVVHDLAFPRNRGPYDLSSNSHLRNVCHKYWPNHDHHRTLYHRLRLHDFISLLFTIEWLLSHLEWLIDPQHDGIESQHTFVHWCHWCIFDGNSPRFSVHLHRTIQLLFDQSARYQYSRPYTLVTSPGNGHIGSAKASYRFNCIAWFDGRYVPNILPSVCSMWWIQFSYYGSWPSELNRTSLLNKATSDMSEISTNGTQQKTKKKKSIETLAVSVSMSIWD